MGIVSDTTKGVVRIERYNISFIYIERVIQKRCQKNEGRSSNGVRRIYFSRGRNTFEGRQKKMRPKSAKNFPYFYTFLAYQL